MDDSNLFVEVLLGEQGIIKRSINVWKGQNLKGLDYRVLLAL